MLLTAPLLTKSSSFFGSLINKCRPAFAVNYASLSSISPATSTRTLEEQVGLPPRPKKPLTPYFRFLKEQRPKLMAQNPKYTTIDVVRVLSKQWVSAEPLLKKRLQDEYQRDQQKYVEVRAKYDATITEEQRAELKQLKQDLQDAKQRRIMRKRVKDLGRPKKPASSFLRFVVEQRTSSPQTAKETYREWHHKCTEKWARLSDAEKETYMQDARKEMEKYKKAIIQWEEKMMRLGHIDVVRQSNVIDPPEPKPRKQ